MNLAHTSPVQAANQPNDNIPPPATGDCGEGAQCDETGKTKPFKSILFPNARPDSEPSAAPNCFRDLNLDQVINTIVAGRQDYNLTPFFYLPLTEVDAIAYRHEVVQDLADAQVLEAVRSFAQHMRTMREYLKTVEKLYYRVQKQRWFLDAVGIYCQAVQSLAHNISLAPLKSRGFTTFRDYLLSYSISQPFIDLEDGAQKLYEDLAAIRYCTLIQTGRVRVRKYAHEIDYSDEVQQVFEKFKQGAAKEYKIDFAERSEMNHIEAKILEFVVRLYPEVFSRLETFQALNADYVDGVIEEFDREIQFYVAYLEFTEPIKQHGLKFCYPEISPVSKEIYSYEGFDIALANNLVTQDASIVCNDLYLRNPERIFVVSGPNQGGKTTFARACGQLHYLASIGLPVPGRESRLFLFDKIFTHFEREEDLNNLRGKLQDDVVRVREILEEASPRSIIILNEIFTSTTLKDATFLSKRVIEKIVELDVLCVWVTFVDELTSYSHQVVSMVSTVIPDDPTIRTYKILRKPAAGLAYALSIAAKHQLTYDQLKDRLGL